MIYARLVIETSPCVFRETPCRLAIIELAEASRNALGRARAMFGYDSLRGSFATFDFV